jgi:hypothetical protein
MALVGLFGILPFTYGSIQDDALREEASAAGQQYLDRVRLSVQVGRPVPQAADIVLSAGSSIATGQVSDSAATLSLSATCVQPDGAGTMLYDCTVAQSLTTGAQVTQLAPLETFVTRQL